MTVLISPFLVLVFPKIHSSEKELKLTLLSHRTQPTPIYGMPLPIRGISGVWRPGQAGLLFKCEITASLRDERRHWAMGIERLTTGSEIG